MPQTDPSKAFPGVLGKDYRFIIYGGKVYVVYALQGLEVSWRISDEDLKTYGIDKNDIKTLSKNAFGNLQNLGSWDEVRSDVIPEEHPFKTWLKRLRRANRGASWLDDDKFMSVMLEGWAEGWSEAEILKVLQGTPWYQSRTEQQRRWELDLSRADRKNELTTWTQQVSDALQELYGTGFNLKDAGITQKDIKKWAENIASGKWGDPSVGFQYWLSNQQANAEEVEGTPAWISEQQGLEEQRAFANRTEDMFQALKDEAAYWLGPMAVPSNGTLKKWANDLVSEVASDADWKQWLQKQTTTAYPYLGANTPWQEFVDPYKSILEKTWGTPVDWSHPLLSDIAASDESGKATGGALSFREFEVLARKDPLFWQGDAARQEGFELLNTLQSVFQGVQ